MVSFIVFGASGHLAHKKTFPALYNLYLRNTVNRQSFYVVGYARNYIQPQGEETKIYDEFIKRVSYFCGQYDQADSFKEFNKYLQGLEKSTDPSKSLRIFYVALPPSAYVSVGNLIHDHAYLPDGKTRIIIEKPFGDNYDSSIKLKEELHKKWKEDEIYRIDHYLAKDMVINIPTLRFANPHSLDALLNNHHIKSVGISMWESGGCEGRVGYYDINGVVRDVLQNHMAQIFTVAAMDEPKSEGPDDVRYEKVKVLKATKPASLKDSILGQYTAGQDKPGYKDLEGVPKESKATTYVATTLYVDNERWKGVPFVFDSGKSMSKGKVEIRYYLKGKDSGVFSDVNQDHYISFTVQPNQEVTLTAFVNKPMSSERSCVNASLNLNFKEQFAEEMKHKRDAYEILFEDAIKGNPTKFVRYDEVEYAWRIFDEILDSPTQPLTYPAGSNGPKESEQYLKSHLKLIQ
ncbi:glucose-6-phosphate 1-dehydrogenase [Schizosaccharomyces cryophilus OY26]|uniref:Glucose-6-phosphate 1-dehydrogenase n=1 Tax=Schizosaccharomyces cryophilus (strain OY26 / ATCC MYA-4695 / CBS 11777 / NBRC 106824 / NRRL Y48691) TaxID=653667 RepID=S9X3M5_SCHCR|nr:glucose-6-phosphate 1-dehydrogenase [Schizosaccharomyces cryophilus OY26]EPY51707.1 glucose-6-phosphate 1-dehydrogenase [Schizosaccharomyces cryophilus OY26]